MEEIRPLTRDELPACDALLNFAFQRTEITEEPLVEAAPDQIWGCFIDGELASTVIVLPHEVFVHGAAHGLGLIAGVATWPEYRKGGKIAKLLVRSLRVMKESGRTLSYLVPFSYAFYRKYGWELTHDYRRYTLPAEHVPVWSGKGRIKRLKKPDIGLLNAVYASYAVRFNGMLKRSEDHWRRTVLKRKPGQIVVYYNEANEARGYMIYEDNHNAFNVHELVCLDGDAQRGLWAHIRKHEGMYASVTWMAPADDPFPFLMDNPKRLETRLAPHLMSRIVDVAEFLRRYPFVPAEVGAPLTVTVADPHADWNDGTFRIELDGRGNADVRRLNGRAADDGILCDIQTFTALMMGTRDARFLRAIGRLAGGAEQAERWGKAIPARTNYYLDFGR
jgi:predicted acetyltransferase